MNLRGILLIWIGLMGVAATAAALVLLRLFPRAFSESGTAIAWPWQRDAARPARARGRLILAVAVVSAVVALAGVASLLF